LSFSIEALKQRHCMFRILAIGDEFFAAPE
jgi:hypothetical protein